MRVVFVQTGAVDASVDDFECDSTFITQRIVVLAGIFCEHAILKGAIFDQLRIHAAIDSKIDVLEENSIEQQTDRCR